MTVRPNRWDDREARLEDLLARASNRLQELRPEMHDGRLDNLSDATLVRRIADELNTPRHADVDRRVPSWVVRWWRERRLLRG